MAETRIVINAVDNASGVLKSLGGTATGIFQGIGQAAFNAFGNVVSGAFDSVKKSMIDGNAEFERYQTQFGVLLGDAGLAKERLADLAEFGAKTPFELPEVVRADKILQAFGLHSEDVADRFGMSGEQIRTIAGDTAAGTGASFEEIAGYLGKFSSGATGEAIARMQELGITTRAELKEMGLEFSKSGELLTPIDEAMDVLLVAMQDKFGGMMDAQSSTFEGMMSNFQDWLGAAGRTIGEPFFALAKQGLGRTLEMLNAFMPTLQSWAGLLGDAFEMFLSGNMAGGVENLFGILESFFTLIGVSGPQQAEIFRALWAAFDAITSIDFSPLISAFMTLLDVMGVQFPTTQDSITAVAGALAAFATGTAEFLNNVAIPALTAVVSWISANWPTIVTTVQTVMTQVQTVIQTVLAAVQEFWAQWGDEIIGIINFFTSQYSTIFQAFSQAFSGDWRGFGETLRNAWDRAWAAIREIAQNAISWFLTQDWGAIGQSIVAGIGAGIQAAAAGLAAAAVAAAQAAVDAVKGFLGVHSPSRVFADIGHNMMAGMAQGITATAAMPAYAAAGAGAMAAQSVYMGGVNISVSGAGDPSAVAYAVRAELDRMGRAADSRIRTGTR